MSDARRSWSYWPRRAVLWFASYDHEPCRLRECPESTVGFSVWCRRHTDMIVGAIQMDARLWDALSLSLVARSIASPAHRSCQGPTPAVGDAQQRQGDDPDSGRGLFPRVAGAEVPGTSAEVET